ncbi:MAG: hypothetical protein BMS9Abin06_0710 [Gammaproteobacteria bacterium]|nr:MAG: hypothetical protein BMS9Abin06_0710 [Gammaproteobacteria bacterium]
MRSKNGLRSWGASVAALATILTLLASNAMGQCKPEFRQVNVDGFGDRFNSMAFSMKVFGDYLYVGVGSRSRPAELWRYDGNTWQQITDTGFGNPNNRGIRALRIYRKQLYAATINQVEGAEIWRSADGLTWEPVMTGGFGTPINGAVRSLMPFMHRLYAGTQRLTLEAPTIDAPASAPDSKLPLEAPVTNALIPGQGSEVWRSFNGGRWVPINEDGFGNLNNQSAHTMGILGGVLYVGTRNVATGGEIWRTTDGVSFEQVVGPQSSTPGGFGNPDTALIVHMKNFKGKLYVATANLLDGFALMSTSDGKTYEQIGEPGFGDPDNGEAWRMHKYQGALWLGVANLNVLKKGGSLWRTFDGTTWEEMIGQNGTYMSYGFDDTKNWGIRSMETYNGKLYIGTSQCEFGGCSAFISGAEVWEWSGEAGCR